MGESCGGFRQSMDRFFFVWGNLVGDFVRVWIGFLLYGGILWGITSEYGSSKDKYFFGMKTELLSINFFGMKTELISTYLFSYVNRTFIDLFFFVCKPNFLSAQKTPRGGIPSG